MADLVWAVQLLKGRKLEEPVIWSYFIQMCVGLSCTSLDVARSVVAL